MGKRLTFGAYPLPLFRHKALRVAQPERTEMSDLTKRCNECGLYLRRTFTSEEVCECAQPTLSEPAEQVQCNAGTEHQSAPSEIPAPAAGPSAVEEVLHPVVQEAIDNYARYYAEHHKLGMSIRSDMMYVAQLALRWRG